MNYLKYSLAVCWLLFSANVAMAAIDDDLVALYGFESNLLDSSPFGNANHGVGVNGPGFTAGRVGSALSLTGVQDYMTLSPSLTDLNFGDTGLATDVDFTMAMWIRQDDNVSDPAVLSNKDWDSGNNIGINWAVTGNGFFDLNVTGSTAPREDLDGPGESAALSVGQWNLVVMSVDRDGPTELYVNGVNTGTIATTPSGTFNTGQPWNIGQDGFGSYSVEFTGAVDELAIWRRAITAGEASQLWNGGLGIDLDGVIVESALKLIVDRDNGAMTIENNTGVAQDISGYQITSAAGAFSQSGWTPVAGRLDGAGDQSIDTNNWIAITAPGSASDLSEIALGMGSLGNGDSIELGPGTWAKFYEEQSDVVFRYYDGSSSSSTLGLIEFVGGGNDPDPYPFADLNFDGQLNSDDWTALQSNFGASLASLSEAQRYRLSDLNNDGMHTLDDILTFQITYDEVNGSGTFQAMINGVPEPSSACLLLLAAAALVGIGRKRSPSLVVVIVAVPFLLLDTASAAVVWSENFDGVSLGPNVDEGLPGANVWTNTPPVNWTIDNSSMPAGGVTEWRGWAFADPAWWSAAAADQGRSQFTKGSGAVAIADPDEWFDIDPGSVLFNSFLETPNISLAGQQEDTLSLRFDSSWMPEDDQTANLTVSFDGAPEIELFRWESVNGSNFKAADTNETVVVPLNNPVGAANMKLRFGLTNGDNDWWWAIDNLEVFTPLTLQVDVQTGDMEILGDSSVDLNGYEINSPGGSLAPAGWLAGNLDAQGVGSSVPGPSDFDSSGLVDSADINTWENAYGSTAAGDADRDGDTDAFDFLRVQRDYGSTGDPASTWLTFLGTQNQLIESYLFGSSVLATDTPIGDGYDTSDDLRDLVFTYTTADNEKLTGTVVYTNLPVTIQTVPEPLSVGMSLVGFIIFASRRSRC